MEDNLLRGNLITESRAIFIVAGEASGDLYGARLIEASCRRQLPLTFRGVAGPRMVEAGCQVDVPSAELSVIGLVEVIGKIPVIRRALRNIETIFRRTPPALVVLIDFADFNLKVAKIARRYGIPVLYYISPKVWVWRKGRAKKIARLVNRMATIFPFEAACYAPHGLQVDYVGHPLLDEPLVTEERGQFLCNLGLDPAKIHVGLFPGSRNSEVRYCWQTLLETAHLLQSRYPDLVFLVPVAPTLNVEDLQASAVQSGLSIHYVEGESIYNVSNACSAVVSVSGTVTLQVALCGTPHVLFYKVAPLTYQIGRLLIQTPFVGLPNIVAGREVVRELIQDGADASSLAEETGRILFDAPYRSAMVQQLKAVQGQMGTGGAASRVIDIMLEMVA